MRQKHGPPVIQTARIPAPVGLNTVQGWASIGPEDCLSLYNVVSGAGGLQVRSGYREWVTGLTGLSDDTVPTMIPYTGSAGNGSKNKLFAVTSTGIWDATDSTDTPSQVLAFSSSAGSAGRGTSTVVVTSAGHFLLYADEENGLFQYTESTDTWAASAVTGITGGVAAVAFVMMWKGRVFMVEKDTTLAWYLDTGAITGAANSFDFAQRFKAGGHLVGLWSWTYDGGAGIDDALVAISSGGDVAIYKGTDITNVDLFGLNGVWQLGGVPAGRRIATDTGGDLLLLSTQGALPVSKLVVGGGGVLGQYATAKIANEFTRLMSLHRATQGWGMFVHPGDNALLVTVPEYGAQEATSQLAMSFASGGWSRFADLPVCSACVWDGEFYFGTNDGRVCRGVDAIDNSQLASPEDFETIDWRVLTRYHNLGNANWKRVELIKPILLSGQAVPAITTAARYDYDLRDAAIASGTGTGGSSVWDEGLWDEALWGDYESAQIIHGASGMGRDVAIAIRGNARSRTTLVGFDVFFNVGGPL